MHRHPRALAACLALVLGAAACSAPATGVPVEPVHGTSPVCPLDTTVSLLVGDSLAVEWGTLTDWPSGVVPFNDSFGGVAYTAPRDVLSVAGRIRYQLETCGGLPGRVLLSAGVNDFARGEALEPVIAAVQAVDAELAVAGIPVTWFTVLPYSDYNRPGGDVRDLGRAALNQWLTTPGNVTGDVVDCQSAIADPARPAFMDPRFHRFLGPYQVDNFHPNDDGYRAIAACVGAHPGALAAPPP